MFITTCALICLIRRTRLATSEKEKALVDNLVEAQESGVVLSPKLVEFLNEKKQPDLSDSKVQPMGAESPIRPSMGSLTLTRYTSTGKKSKIAESPVTGTRLGQPQDAVSKELSKIDDVLDDSMNLQTDPAPDLKVPKSVAQQVLTNNIQKTPKF